MPVGEFQQSQAAADAARYAVSLIEGEMPVCADCGGAVV